MKNGIASDYGRNSIIDRVPREDMILYQTERYDLQKFSYEIDVIEDGDYVLWLKFSEVWFNGPNLKVSFDPMILINLFSSEKRRFFSCLGFSSIT